MRSHVTTLLETFSFLPNYLAILTPTIIKAVINDVCQVKFELRYVIMLPRLDISIKYMNNNRYSAGHLRNDL